MTGFTCHKGLIFPVDASGERGHLALSIDELRAELRRTRPRTIMVHGYKWNPDATDDDNPHIGQFKPWREWVGQDALGYAWYSNPSIFDAWRHGRYNTYRRAWDIAGGTTAYALSMLFYLCLLERLPINVVAHSLGSRVVIQALNEMPPHECAVQRVLLLNGAEYSESARDAARSHPRIDFRNVVVSSDAVLRFLGALFAPGQFYAPVVGLHGVKNAPKNWTDIRLDDPATIAWGREQGWDIRGDNPLRVFDHWYSFRWPGNWPFLQAVLKEGASP